MYTFILCQSFAQSPDTVLGNLIEWQRLHGRRALPNLIVSLADGFIQAARVEAQGLRVQVSPVNSDGLVFAPAPDRSFAYLVNDLRRHIREGRTVPLSALDRYMTSVTNTLPHSIGRRFEIEGDT